MSTSLRFLESLGVQNVRTFVGRIANPSRTEWHSVLLGCGFAALGLLLCCFACSAAQAADFYVATDGSDASPGTEEKPFATIARARGAVRETIAQGLTEDVTVVIRGGIYRVTEPIVFGLEDSGTEERSITYEAAHGEKPVIRGGRVITGWTAGDDGIWRVELPDVESGKWSFRQLWVNGSRVQRARHPNEGYLRAEKVGADRRTNFQFREGDLRSYDDVQDVELVFLHDWSITRVPLKSIDEMSRTLTVQHQVGGPGSWCRMDWFEKQPRYYLENSAAFLDAPGEWHLDCKNGVLSYRPRAGEEIGQVEVVAPVAGQLLAASGDTEKNCPIRNLHFVGLAFEHAGWSPPDGVYWGRQACTYWSPNTPVNVSHHEADPAAVQFDLAEACSFQDGRVAHVGASGIWLGRGCQAGHIIGTVVSDTGGNGVMIGEGQPRNVGDEPWWQAAPEEAASGNIVTNCVVERCGQELFGAVGVWVGLAAKTTIAHNEVRFHPYTGVSIGWMWWNPRSRPEPRETPCEQTIVADNHIHHIMLTLSDGGGIYSLGSQPGSALRGNLIHDVPVNVGRAESNGMFLDQGTGNFVIEQNVIYNVPRSPLRFHKGWENVVRNNVLEVREGAPTVRYNDTVVERITLEDNTIVEKVPDSVLKQARKRAGLEPAYREGLQ